MNDKMLQSQLQHCHIYYLYDVGFIWLKSTSDFFLTTLRIPEAFRDVLDN